MTYPSIGSVNESLVSELRRFATIRELRQSEFYRRNSEELTKLFNQPAYYPSDQARPRLKSFLRVLEWNVERGTRLEGIIDALNSHPVLRFADLLLLNELDHGMVRSGNINVAAELGRALSTHVIYGVEYLELTKGVGHELALSGENAVGLHGNAILSRYPILNPQVVRLPRCEDNFSSKEKRLGGRLGISVNIDSGGLGLVAATAHLDVVNTPKCRARQLRALLQFLDSRLGGRQSARSILVGGDLNTHTFSRGGRWRAARNAAVVTLSNPADRIRRLLNPIRREPALVEFSHFGYELSSLNDGSPTASGIVSHRDFPDASRLPRPVYDWAMRRIGPDGLRLEFRLDWFAARGAHVLKAGEAIDRETGVSSIDPQTFPRLVHRGSRLSDHDPIVVDIAL